MEVIFYSFCNKRDKILDTVILRCTSFSIVTTNLRLLLCRGTCVASCDVLELHALPTVKTFPGHVATVAHLQWRHPAVIWPLSVKLDDEILCFLLINTNLSVYDHFYWLTWTCLFMITFIDYWNVSLINSQWEHDSKTKCYFRWVNVNMFSHRRFKTRNKHHQISF